MSRATGTYKMTAKCKGVSFRMGVFQAVEQKAAERRK